MGVFGLTPGSVVKSKSSPERRPCTLIALLVWTVPFTDQTPVSMFLIAAFTCGSGFSWPDPVAFFCGLAKAIEALPKKMKVASAHIQIALRDKMFVIKLLCFS